MDGQAVLDFYCGNSSIQIFSNIIPQIGSVFEFHTCRDKNGNYAQPSDPKLQTGPTHLEFVGIVRKIRYLYEETGMSAATNHQTMYVRIDCGPVPENTKKSS